MNRSPNRFRLAITVGAAAAAAVTIAGSAAAAPAEGAPRQPDAVPGGYIVVYENRVEATGRRTTALERRVGFRAGLRYREAIDGFAAQLAPGQVRRLRSSAGVAAVSPDYRVEAAGSAPLATGETAPTGVRRILAVEEGAAHEASDANVAVIDSGVDLAHPDLNAAVGTDCVDPGSSPADDNGHGTHVAGTIAARNQGAGVVGVAPGTKVFAVKVLDAEGGGTFSQIICGIDWVTATRTDSDPANDIAVANMSLGGIGDPVSGCDVTADPLHRAICRSTAAGITYVAAAGNSGWDFDYAPAPDVPAAYPQVLTVTAASDSDGAPGAVGGAPACTSGEADDRYASFSNFAATAAGLAHTVAAPGVCIRSTVPGGGYGTSSGTSMAAPHVAGVAALCIGEGSSAGPCADLAPAQVAQRVRADAEQRTTTQPGYGFVGDPAHPVSGGHFGYLASAEHPDEPTATPEPVFTQVVSSPSAAVIESGSLRAGSHARLAANDGSYFQVNSTKSGTRTTSWHGRFGGISNELRSLNLTYSGRNSAACRQTISLWRWTTSSWVQLDSRDVGSGERLLEMTPTSGLADYVSGDTGDGEARVRVRCTRSSNFYASADLMALAHERPVG